MTGYIHIYAPPVVDRAVHRATCLDCKKTTRMLSFFQDWHGWHSTCIHCGRQWDGGEWLELEFRRGVRKQNIANAKRRWRRLTRTGLAKSDVFA
jgi:hypothetical protein